MKVLFKTAIVVTIISMVMSMPAFAASTKDELIELQKEVQALKAGQDSMKNDLAAIKKMLESGARAAPPKPKPFEPRDVMITGASVMGNANPSSQKRNRPISTTEINALPNSLRRRAVPSTTFTSTPGSPAASSSAKP